MAGRTKWEARWPEGGNRRSRLFDRKADADRWDTEKRRERQLAQYAPRQLSKDTVGAVLDDWLAWQVGERAPSTIYQRTTVLKRRLRTYGIAVVPVSELSRRHVIAWQDDLRRDGASAIERNRAKAALSACLSWAADRDLIDSNPALGIKASREPTPERRALTPLAVERIRHQMPDGTSRALVSALAWCGLRVQEALALRADDIRPGRLRISRAVSLGEITQTKTRQERIVPLLPPVKDDLETALPLLFANVNYTVWLRSTWHPARERAKIPKVTPAYLRHTYATLRLYEGSTPQDLHRDLGHASWTTTLVHYAHSMTEAKYEPKGALLDAILDARRQAERGDEGEDVDPYLIGF